MASTQPMGLLKKYELLKAILSTRDRTSIARQFRCSVDEVNKFKVAAVKFISEFEIKTAEVHFKDEVQVKEIPVYKKRSGELGSEDEDDNMDKRRKSETEA